MPSRLARWDKRVPGKQQVQSISLAPTIAWVQGKDYGRGTNFTCLATSGEPSPCKALAVCHLPTALWTDA